MLLYLLSTRGTLGMMFSGWLGPQLIGRRQVLVRLPVTRAVVFSIHTYMVRPEALSSDQRARLEAVRPGVFAGAPA